MKRDMSAVREILAFIEAKPASVEPSYSFDYPDRLSPEEALGHLELAIQGGLVDGEIQDHRAPVLLIRGLTWQGHDFLDAVRDESVWKKVLERAAKAGLDLSIELATELGRKYAREKLGL